MRRDQLEHAIRTACQIIGADAVIVVGSRTRPQGPPCLGPPDFRSPRSAHPGPGGVPDLSTASTIGQRTRFRDHR